MPTLLERIQSVWNHVQAAPARTRAHFPVSRTHIDNGGQLGPPFKDKDHYFQIVINEMFLANAREWWVNYDPMAFVASSYIYDTKIETSPFVVGPAMLEQFKQQVPEGMIFRNAPVSGLHPYQGGSLTLTIILNKLQRKNNAEKLLKVVEGISSAIDPSTAFSSYIKMAGTILDGVEAIFGLEQTEPVLGYHVTFNPQIGQTLEPSYFVMIDVDEAQVDQNRFWVKNHRLHYGQDLAGAKPYLENDFILLSIGQGDKRTDERTLPFFPLWLTAQDLAAQPDKHFWEEAKAHFNTLKRNLLKSPDLTKPDYQRFRDQYFEELAQRRKEAVMESELTRGKGLSDTEDEFRQIADKLNELDNL
jgi:hypothetical protein